MEYGIWCRISLSVTVIFCFYFLLLIIIKLRFLSTVIDAIFSGDNA